MNISHTVEKFELWLRQKAYSRLATGLRMSQGKLIYKVVLASSMFVLMMNSSIAQNIVSEKTMVTPLFDVWQKAALNSRKINIAGIQLLQSKEELKNAEIARLPDVSLDGEFAKLTKLPQFEDGILKSPTYYPIASTSYSLGASVFFNLYNGGHLNRRVDAQKINLKISEQQRNLTVAEIKLLAAAYYLDLLRGRAFQELIQQDIAEQDKVLKQIKVIYKNGVVLKSDVLRAELKLSKQKLQADQIKSDNAVVTKKINLLTGQPDETLIAPVAPFLPDTVQVSGYEALLSAAAAGAHELNISAEERKLEELNLRDVKARILPSIGLFADYAYSYPQGQFYPYVLSLYGFGSVGIRASLPVSALFKNKHHVSVASLEVQKSVAAHLDLEDQIKNQLKEAYLRFQDDLKRIRVAKNNINQATENLRIVKNSYLNQTSLITDYLDADVQLLQSKFDLTAARIAAQLQFYQIKKIIGNL